MLNAERPPLVQEPPELDIAEGRRILVEALHGFPVCVSPVVCWRQDTGLDVLLM